MQIKMKMPDLATTDSEMTINAWLVEVGQEIKRGQVLLEVETDKASMEVESFLSGKLIAILSQVGDKIVVGQEIAVIEIQN